MNKKYQKLIPKDELSILEGQLNSEELFILGFLKEFNRKNLKEWDDNELGIFQDTY